MSWNEFSYESLTSISTLCAQSDLNAFVYFVDNVAIKQQLTLTEESAINSFASEMQRFAQKHGIKLIKPLKRLLMRLLERSLGYTNIFIAFLNICLVLNVPSEALQILEYPTFFKGSKQIGFLPFLLYGIEIYIQLRKYGKAFELASKGVSLFHIANEIFFEIAKRYIVLCITLYKPAQFLSQIAQILDTHQHKLDHQHPKKYQQALHFYLSLKEWRLLNETQTVLLQSDKLLDAYKAGEYAKLSCYIENEIKNQNWRIRAQNIRDISVGDFCNISKINSLKSIYKYDCKEKIMYFNHKLCDQDKINELITKSFIMQNELRNLKQVPAFDQSRMMGGVFREMGGKRSGPGGHPGMGRSLFDRRF